MLTPGVAHVKVAPVARVRSIILCLRCCQSKFEPGFSGPMDACLVIHQLFCLMTGSAFQAVDVVRVS